MMSVTDVDSLPHAVVVFAKGVACKTKYETTVGTGTAVFMVSWPDSACETGTTPAVNFQVRELRTLRENFLLAIAYLMVSFPVNHNR